MSRAPRDPAPSFGVPHFPQLLQGANVLTTGFPYKMLEDDCLVCCNKAGAPGAVTVKLPAPWDGRIVGVKDYVGNAGTFAITVDGDGTPIEGGATDTITTDRAERWYRYDEGAAEWKRLWAGGGGGGLTDVPAPIIKSYQGVGSNGAGAITTTGTKIGDRVVAVFGWVTATGVVLGLDTTRFETTVTVANQIQQLNTNLSANTYLFLVQPRS